MSGHRQKFQLRPSVIIDLADRSLVPMPNGAEVIDAFRNIRRDDIVIIFMGPSGAGKSYFIDLLTGQKGKRAKHSLKSVTSQVQATRVTRNGYDDRIVLVDTPGFGNALRSDMEILQIISRWLWWVRWRVDLSGLLYLHRITDNRMAGSLPKNLRMFEELCGDAAMARVRFVSTMWGKVKTEVGEERERELQEKFWKHFIDKGSTIERLRDAKGEEAWRIVDRLIDDCKNRDNDKVLLQEELRSGKRFYETSAAKIIFSPIQKLLADQRRLLALLLARAEEARDSNFTKKVTKEYAKINDQFQRTFPDNGKWILIPPLPLGERIIFFFFGKRPRAKTIKVSEA